MQPGEHTWQEDCLVLATVSPTGIGSSVFLYSQKDENRIYFLINVVAISKSFNSLRTSILGVEISTFVVTFIIQPLYNPTKCTLMSIILFNWNWSKFMKTATAQRTVRTKNRQLNETAAIKHNFKYSIFAFSGSHIISIGCILQCGIFLWVLWPEES
jgi:hypothetical protein